MIHKPTSWTAVVGRGCLLSMLIFLCARCSGTAPVTAEPATAQHAEPEEPAALAHAPSSIVEGQVRGRTLDVESAIFMWRDKADDMQIILSDAPDLCSTLQAGAWPAGGTVLYATIKHTGSENQDAAFGAGVYPLRRDEPIPPQDTKMAQFMVFGPTCELEVREEAVAGEIRISTDQVAIGGVVEGELDLTFDKEVTGRFHAGFCEPAEYEPSGCR